MLLIMLFFVVVVVVVVVADVSRLRYFVVVIKTGLCFFCVCVCGFKLIY